MLQLDEKTIKVDDDDLLLNVKFQRKLGCCYVKKVEREQEIDDLADINLCEITEPQRSTAGDIFCQIDDSDLGHIRVYSLQTLKGTSTDI